MEKKQVTELQALFMRLLPPEEYVEDSNVEEFYNRITDLEEEVSALTKENERLKEQREEHRKAMLGMADHQQALTEQVEKLKDENDRIMGLENRINRQKKLITEPRNKVIEECISNLKGVLGHYVEKHVFGILNSLKK